MQDWYKAAAILSFATGDTPSPSAILSSSSKPATPCPMSAKGVFLISSQSSLSRFLSIFIWPCEKPMSFASRPCSKNSYSSTSWSHMASALEVERPLTSVDASSGVSVRTLRTSLPNLEARASAVVLPRPLMLSERKDAMRSESPASSSTLIFLRVTCGLLFHSVTLPEMM